MLDESKQRWRDVLHHHREEISPSQRKKIPEWSNDNPESQLRMIREMNHLREQSKTWYRLMFVPHCFHHVLVHPAGFSIFSFLLFGWYLLWVNLYWGPVKIAWNQTFSQRYDSLIVIPTGYEEDLQTIRMQQELTLTVQPYKVHARYLQFPWFRDYEPPYTERQVYRIQEQMKLLHVLYEKKKNIESSFQKMGWPLEFNEAYWKPEHQKQIEEYDRFIATTKEKWPLYEELKATCTTRQWACVIPSVPFSLDALEAASKDVEESIQHQEEMLALRVVAEKSLGTIQEEMFAFPYRTSRLQEAKEHVTKQMDAQKKAEVVSKITKALNVPFAPEYPYNVEQIEKVYKNRTQLKRYARLTKQAKDISWEHGLSLDFSKEDLDELEELLLLRSRITKKCTNLYNRAKRMGWDRGDTFCEEYQGKATQEEVQHAHAKLEKEEYITKEMEEVYSSVRRYEKRHKLTIGRPFNRSDLYDFQILHAIRKNIVLNSKNYDYKTWGAFTRRNVLMKQEKGYVAFTEDPFRTNFESSPDDTWMAQRANFLSDIFELSHCYTFSERRIYRVHNCNGWFYPEGRSCYDNACENETDDSHLRNRMGLSSKKRTRIGTYEVYFSGRYRNYAIYRILIAKETPRLRRIAELYEKQASWLEEYNRTIEALEAQIPRTWNDDDEDYGE